MTFNLRTLFWLLMALALIGLAWMLADLLIPFLLCLVLAYMLSPIVDRCEDIGVGRTFGAVLVLSGFLIFLLLLLLILAPVVITQSIALAKAMPEVIGRFGHWLTELMKEPTPALQWLLNQLQVENPEDLQQELMTRINSGFEQFGGEVITNANHILKAIAQRLGSITNSLTLMLLVPVVLFYLLRDWDVLIAKLMELLPPSSVSSAQLLEMRIATVLRGYFRGQLLVVVLLGCFYGVGLALIGVPTGLLVGLLTGLFSFVPYVGMAVGFLLAQLITLVEFGLWPETALVALVFVSGQVLESAVLSPKLIGDNVKLHPVWIIFALLAGGTLMGFAGLLLAIPVVAVLGVIVRFMLEQYQDRRLPEEP